MSYREIKACRICGNDNLIEVLDLGMQELTGVFPENLQQEVTSGPLKLVKCHGNDVCHLLQLQHSYDLDEMYGDNYGYRSGLNQSMVRHLGEKVAKILQRIELRSGDLVIDIGSNDGTTLGFYPRGDWDLAGIDPTAEKFREYYKDYLHLLPDFFSAETFGAAFGDRKARVVTSFSMFYDLEDPLDFAQTVSDILADDGVWVLEQSYMPEMLKQDSYDTVCHEHLEYYGLSQIDWITRQVGLKILDVEFNDVNGGSFSVTLAKENSDHQPDLSCIASILEDERPYRDIAPYLEFAERVEVSRQRLRNNLESIWEAGKTVYGIGASTKGNVILQYCGIDTDLLPRIGEVNSEKYGKFTPGSRIPIVSEDEVLALAPDYLLVLPWHFRRFFEASERFRQTQLIYPL